MNLDQYICPFDQLGMKDVPHVGGKNASLGEMISNLAGLGVQVPGGFATTADAFRVFLGQSGLDDRIHAVLDALDVEDVNALAEAGKNIRQWIVETPFPSELEKAIRVGFDPAYARSSRCHPSTGRAQRRPCPPCLRRCTHSLGGRALEVSQHGNRST